MKKPAHVSAQTSPSKSRKGLVLLLLAFHVALLGMFWNLQAGEKQAIVNMHESVASLEDAEMLSRVMERTAVTQTVIQAIPADLLEYVSGQVTLSNTDNGNDIAAQVATRSPEYFKWFCTIDPIDSFRLEALVECKELGDSGVKLYNGYGYAHLIPLDDARLADLYKNIADSDLPLMMPVNTAKFQTELENVLDQNPELKIIASHFALASKNLSRASDLMRRYPNLWVDTSFGSTTIAMDGFKTMEKNREAYRSFFEEFQDRIVWGTDNVIRMDEGKTEDFEVALFELYKDMLSEEDVSTLLSEEGVLGGTARALKGLNLDEKILKKVFWQNAKNLLE